MYSPSSPSLRPHSMSALTPNTTAATPGHSDSTRSCSSCPTSDPLTTIMAALRRPRRSEAIASLGLYRNIVTLASCRPWQAAPLLLDPPPEEARSLRRSGPGDRDAAEIAILAGSRRAGSDAHRPCEAEG